MNINTQSKNKNEVEDDLGAIVPVGENIPGEGGMMEVDANPSPNVVLAPGASGSSGQDKQRSHLSGAGKKRLRYLLSKGLSLEDARKMATLTVRDREGVTQGKRSRSDGSTPEGDSKRPKGPTPKGPPSATLPLRDDGPKGGRGEIRKPRPKPKPTPGTSGPPHPPEEGKGGAKNPASKEEKDGRRALTLKQVVESVKVAILSRDNSREVLSTAQVEAVQNAIVRRMIEDKRGEIKPYFLGSSARPGFLLLTCGNRETADWVKSSVDKLKLWEGAQVEAVEGDSIPKPQTLIGFFPHSSVDGLGDILDLLEAQNKDLLTGDWKILHGSAEGHGVQLVMSVDHLSLGVLEKTGLLVRFRFGEVQLRRKSKKEVEVGGSRESSRPNQPTEKEAGDKAAAGQTSPVSLIRKPKLLVLPPNSGSKTTEEENG